MIDKNKKTLILALNKLCISRKNFWDLEYWLRYLDFILVGLYLLAVLGDWKKAMVYHNNSPLYKLRNHLRIKKLKQNFYRENESRYDFSGIFLPDLSGNNGYESLLPAIYEDILKIYCEYNDNYDWRIVDNLDISAPEGSYCYVGENGEEILIKPGYIVIDAGAWIGDFSAYAAKKGAKVFAFEPDSTTIGYLEKTAEYNGNITIVPYGLGDKQAKMNFLVGANNTGSSHFHDNGELEIKITTLDAWAEQNSIAKVDFIKADIEGFERYMLAGAKTILKTHAPILSICTYHLPDDPKVLSEIILEANPKYKIIQRKMKLFAYIPNRV